MFSEIAESSRLVHQVGWAMIHSIWQGMFIALSLFLVLRPLKRSTSNVRYVVSCAALALMLFCPVATAIVFDRIPSANTASEAPNYKPGADLNQRTTNPVEISSSGNEQISLSVNSPAIESVNFSGRAEKLFPWLILLWTLGVMLFSLRFGAGVFYTRRLIKSARDLRDPLFESVLEDLTHRLKITRTVRVLESALVKIPMTVGWIYPVILIPPSALLGLTPQQLQNIIAHELAHIKRYDFLVNLLQAVIETLLFYHPAARWISSKIRLERELVCDDLTIALCCDAIVYARALTQVARFGNAASQSPALAATGGDITFRIHRLVNIAPRKISSRSAYLYSTLAIIFLSLIIAAGFAVTFQPNENRWFGNFFSSNVNRIDQPIRTVETSDNYGDNLSNESPQYRQIAVEALEGHRGSVVIMDSQTGQVYSIVNQEWAVRRGWSPASIFKMVTAIAGLQENKLKISENGIGYDRETGMNLTRAIADSDNNYFKSLGKEVGSGFLIKYAKQLGFGRPTGINYDGEINGYVPGNVSAKNDWLGATGGTVEATPLQLAVLMSAIANGGRIVIPQAGNSGHALVPKERFQFDISENTLAELRKGLSEAVKSGTAYGAGNPEREIAGKTGTTIINEEKGIGLFAAYAPTENSSLVVVVVVALEGKNEAGHTAAQVAGKIYQKL